MKKGSTCRTIRLLVLYYHQYRYGCLSFWCQQWWWSCQLRGQGHV